MTKLLISLLLFLSLNLFINPGFTGVNHCGVYLHQTIELEGGRDLERFPNVNFATYNLQDMSFKNSSKAFAKSDQKLKEIADIIYNEKIDFLVLEEIQNQKVLDLFNQKYLNNKYKAVVIEGNDSERKIGFLIEESLPLKFNIETHSHQRIFNNTENKELNLFSRDLPALHIRHKNTSSTDPPDFIFIGTHYKSQRNYKNDIRSVNRRTEQVKKSAEIIKSLEETYPQTPIFLAGDFNADIHTQTEFKDLFKDELLMDSLDLNPKKVASNNRYTQTFHPNGGKTSMSQMDAILVNKVARNKVMSSRIYRYKDRHGIVKPYPQTYDERSLNPSDHFMVIATMNMKKIIRAK